MIVGIPKESWRDERRVALTPAGAYALARAGHTVIVQAEAGLTSGFTPEAYRQAGAAIGDKRDPPHAVMDRKLSDQALHRG